MRTITIRSLSVALLLLVLLPGSAFGQSAEERRIQYITSKLKVYWVPNVTSPKSTAVEILLPDVAAGSETGAFWSAGSVAASKRLVRSLVKAPSDGGDANLQRYIVAILSLTNRPIVLYLVDDTGVTSATAAHADWPLVWSTIAGNRGVWPSASNLEDHNQRTRYTNSCANLNWPMIENIGGQISVGERFLTANAGASGKSTLLHELIHTQDQSSAWSHMFRIRGSWVGYGTDGSHYGTELVPDRSMTYKEGIANTIRLMFDRTARRDKFTWYETDGTVTVERNPSPRNVSPIGPVPSGWTAAEWNTYWSCVGQTAPSPDVWLDARIRQTGTTPTSAGVTYGNSTSTFDEYSIFDLPAEFIMHNEYVLALTLSSYASRRGTSEVFRAIRDVNSQAFRTSNEPFALIITALMRNQGMPDPDGIQTSGGDFRPYFLPLAFVDYFTRMTDDVDDFRAVFKEYLDPRIISAYWDSDERAFLVENYDNVGPQARHLEEIADRFGANVHPSGR